MASHKLQYLNRDTRTISDNVHSTRPPHYQRYCQEFTLKPKCSAERPLIGL